MPSAAVERKRQTGVMGNCSSGTSRKVQICAIKGRTPHLRGIEENIPIRKEEGAGGPGAGLDWGAVCQS